MEKIQAAIHKARSERASRQGTGAKVPVQGMVAPAKDSATTLVDENWAALAPFKPDRRHLERNRIVAFDTGQSAIFYDVLRTKILRRMKTNNWKRLAITSPTAACGKTMTCVNLAFSMGRLTDRKTLVVEADLRRPAMKQTLGLPQNHFFASVLAGEALATDHMVAHGKNLAFGTNRAPARNPAELLSNSRIEGALADLDRQFAPDLTIFDMTPLMVSDDAMAFLKHVDCVLILAACGVTTTAQIDSCEQELASQTNVLGVVLNKCRYLSSGEDYGYDYYG